MSIFYAEELSAEHPTPKPLLPDRIQSCGANPAFLHIAHTIGLLPILKQTFPTKWKQLFTYAQYMVCEGNVMQHCLLWNEHTATITDDISSGGSSELFASLSFPSRMAFFRTWIAANRGIRGALNAYVAYHCNLVAFILQLFHFAGLVLRQHFR